MRKKEAPKIKFVFNLKLRLLVFALLGCFLYYKLQSYQKVKLSYDQIEMMPMLVPGQNVYLFSHPKKSDYKVGDTIYFRQKEEPSFHFARIVAKDEGQLRIYGKNLYVGDNLHLPTQDSIPSQLQKNYNLKKGEFFLVQDQQGANWLDSVSSGPFHSDQLEILGKLFFYMEQSEEAEKDK